MTNLSTKVCVLTGLKDYSELIAPFGPDSAYPEFVGCPWAAPSMSANPVYEGVRQSLVGLGLDKARFGSPAWNPLRELVQASGRVTIKPNMVRHWNENQNGSWQSVVTHWSVVRPLIDYALLAVSPTGRVLIGDAAQWDCNMDVLNGLLEVPSVLAHYETTAPGQVRFADFRREYFDRAGPIKSDRHSLPGDPLGYVEVDLGDFSAFNDPKLDPERFFSSEHDNTRTVESHSNGHHRYLISKSCLDCDLFINVPKLKTHHLLGISVAMKNLVGINGDKNLLPHYRIGFVDEGGDQHPARTFPFMIREMLFKVLRPILRAGLLVKPFGYALGLLHKLGGRNVYAGGSWIGNDTVWRMALDLNRILLFAGIDGAISSSGQDRRYLTIVDGIIAGEGEGPMAPQDRLTGAILAAGSPFTCDLVAARVMGFDVQRLKLIVEGMRDHPLPLNPIKTLDDLDLAFYDIDSGAWTDLNWQFLPKWDFLPPVGWQELVQHNEKGHHD